MSGKKCAYFRKVCVSEYIRHGLLVHPTPDYQGVAQVVEAHLGKPGSLPAALLVVGYALFAVGVFPHAVNGSARAIATLRSE